MHNRFSLFLAAIVWTGLLSVAFGFAFMQGWFGSTSEANRYFCEYARSGLLREPANTVSNLAFVVSGLIMAWQAERDFRHKRSNPFAQKPLLVFLFSAFSIFLGFGSAALHGSETDLGGELDLLGMYFTAAFMVAHAVRRFFGWSWSAFVTVFLFGVLFCKAAGLYSQIAVPVVSYTGSAAFALLIVIATAFEVANSLTQKVRREDKWGVYAAISFVVAFAIWNLGRNDHPSCDPVSWLQPHAIWHLLFALALYFVFRLYASEKAPEIKT
ncbi:MAG TPA: ceramidase domain-containing protein [Xanthobacteraceae bacterium]|nr:ceramidase domain-containing protein [Xanthobacteraceae bacterium]